MVNKSQYEPADGLSATVLFDSFDPRYNRRCESCMKSVHGHDDRYIRDDESYGVPLKRA